MELGNLSSDYVLRNKGNFASFWKKLNTRDIQNVRQQIDSQQYRGRTDASIISSLQNRPKLAERYQAVRAYRTESKVLETRDLKAVAADKGIRKFKVIPEQGACELCMKLFEGGRRVFTEKTLNKNGKELVPAHPQCRCTLVLHLQ